MLNSAEAQNILASLHGLSLSVSPDHEFKMVAQCAHVGSATKHLEPGPLALVTAPCSEAMSAGLESQAAWGKVFKVTSCAPGSLD